MLHSNTARRSRELRLPDDGESTNPRSGLALPRPQPGDVAPLAAYLRYKVMRCKDGGGVVGGKRSHSQTEETRIKFFDFIFEGQSEFIDVHQFTLISRAVQFALADADALKTWYEQEKSQLDQKVTT